MTALSRVTIDRALQDENLLGAALGPAETWATWLTVLRAAFGLTLAEDELSTFSAVAGDRKPPTKRVREVWAIVGRRSGKSRVAAAVAAFVAAFAEHGKLSPGETGFVLVLAASRTQAQAVFSYIRAFFEASPILRQLLDGEPTADEIRLIGGVSISVHTNSYRTVRGRTLIAAIFDEVGFWRDENSSAPDVETYRAVLPALATTGGMLVGISSPYAQRGLLYSKHRDCFGKDNPDVLVIQAGTKTFNPTIDPSIIDQAREEDPEAAAAEWEGRFRGDLSTFIDRNVVERLVELDVRERPHNRNYHYTAFVDPSGGMHDSMTLAIAHREGDNAVLDCTREVKPPFAPADVVAEFARTLAAYRISSVTGDRYAGAWVSDNFKANGIRYVASERSRSEIYLDALPLMMAGDITLLDDNRLVSQISQLERRTSRSGRDSVDHMPGASDDLANAVMGAVTNVPSGRRAAAGRSTKPQVLLGYADLKRGRLGSHVKNRL